MVSKIKKSKIVCVSHREDADGISSAALIKQAFGGETILTDYPGMMDDMEPLRTDEKLKELLKLTTLLNHHMGSVVRCYKRGTPLSLSLSLSLCVCVCL